MIFQTAIMKLTDSSNNLLADNLRCQLDTVNIPIELTVERTIPNDYFDLYSLGWTSPVPARGNYFVDKTTGAKYGVYGRTAVYADHLEVRVALPLGVTP